MCNVAAINSLCVPARTTSGDCRQDRLSGFLTGTWAEVSKSISNLSNANNRYFVVLEPPGISDAFESRLQMDREIRETLRDNIYFKYTLYSIFNLIDATLGVSSSYRVSVEYKVYDEILGWSRARIYVKLENADFDVALNAWEHIGEQVDSFFTALKKSSDNIWPKNMTSRLSDLITIEFDSSD